MLLGFFEKHPLLDPVGKVYRCQNAENGDGHIPRIAFIEEPTRHEHRMVEIGKQYQKAVSKGIMDEMFVGVERMPAHTGIIEIKHRQNRQRNSDQ